MYWVSMDVDEGASSCPIRGEVALWESPALCWVRLLLRYVLLIRRLCDLQRLYQQGCTCFELEDGLLLEMEFGGSRVKRRKVTPNPLRLNVNGAGFLPKCGPCRGTASTAPSPFHLNLPKLPKLEEPRYYVKTSSYGCDEATFQHYLSCPRKSLERWFS